MTLLDVVMVDDRITAHEHDWWRTPSSTLVCLICNTRKPVPQPEGETK